jgi:phosphoglycolate phosphatase
VKQEPRLPSLLVFDWDGTLIDSAGRIVACLRAAAIDLGLPDRSDAVFGDVIGLGLPQAIERLYPGLDAPTAGRYRDRYAECFVAADAQPSGFFPGVMETLLELRRRGHAVAVATGKSRRGLDRVLGRLGLESFFDATRCADETASKPDPRMVHEILAQLGRGGDEALVVGDTEYDLEMAARAGVASVGVTYGVHAAERLRRHRPVRIIDSLPELLAWPSGSAPQDRGAEILEVVAEENQG